MNKTKKRKRDANRRHGLFHLSRDDWRLFVRGYLQGLGFTGHRYTKEQFDSGSPDSAFDSPGGQNFNDYVNVREELAGNLYVDELRTIVSDCKGFLTDCHAASPIVWGTLLADLEQAGTDFHFTRNGHGAGFWDGDWGKFGDKLTELSKTYGTAELSCYVADDGSETWDIGG